MKMTSKPSLGQRIFPNKKDSKQVRTQKTMVLVVVAFVILALAAVSTIYAINAGKNNDQNTMNASVDQSSEESSSEPESSEETSSEPESSEEVSSQEESSEPVSSKASTSSKKPTSSKAQTSSKAPVATSSKAQTSSTTPVSTGGMPEGYQPQFADWYKANKEVKGQLIVPNTKVNYPVPQTNNNNYYLDKTITKQHNAWGVPYMDYRVTISPEYTSTNIVVYGHSDDKKGLQLSGVKNYRDINFYKQNPVIEFNTVYENAKWKVIGIIMEDVSGKTPGWFQYHNFIDSKSDADFNNFIANVKLRSFINTTVDVDPSDKLLTISTCRTTTDPDNRLALVARKVRPGESESVDTSGAIKNPTQKLPERYKG